ncbi:MAG TPA: right-handed parallel beta-helix repeat-containing protein [Gaiellaceae bacterium]
MRGRRAFRGLWAAAACAASVLGPASSAGGAIRDDSAWLQAKLDAGGAVFLPRLPDGKCYATRGLWVSRDDTTVTSDGACIVALGPGEGRIPRGDGTFVTANAVFFVDHSDLRKPLPVRIAISGLHITVPAGKRMHGISVLGHEVTLTSLTIDGSPLTDVRIGAGTKGSGGMSGRIAVTDSTLSGGLRDVVSVFGPVGLRVEGNVLSGARGKTAAGLHIRAADRGQPTLDVHVTGNKVAANSGPGIFLDLAPANGLPVLASGIEIARNEIIGNAREAPKVRRGGVVLAGGQSDGKGQIVVRENVFRGNRGPDLLRRKGPPANIKAGPRSVPPPSTAPVRDDTAWLQARLDRAGGTIFLPKLPNGECYATRGLWVSRDGTTITSDGACIVSLGLGPVRLHSIDGDPIAASAVFFVNRSTPSKPAPVRISISNLRIVVPEGQSMYGVAVFGHQITLSHLDIGGSPKDDVTISGRGNGNSYAGSISIIDSTLSGASRNAVSATAVIGLRIERNTIVGVRDSPPGQPAAGIDVEPDDRGQPALDVRIVGNTILDNAGPGILLELEPNDGPAVVATALEISGNTILRNSAKRTPPKRGGIVLAGGQDGGQGTLVLRDNVIRGNGGPGILESRLRLLVDSAGNDVSGNETA